MATTRSSRRRLRRAELFVALLLLLGGCGGSPTGPETREEQFDELWATFDRTYPYFTYKQIDWDQARATYREAAIATPSMEAFSLVVRAMLAQLRDVHVYVE